MSEKPDQPSPREDSPISSFDDPIGQLLRERLLQPAGIQGARARLDRFNVIEPLGNGGMAFVFKARDSETGGIVAIKQLKPELRQHPHVMRQFLREARHLSHLKHPNLVPVIAVSDQDENPWFAMPCYPATLARLIKPGQPMRADQVLAIARPIASALHYLHITPPGVTHRDVKPGNILIAGDGSPVLADLGLARTVFNDSLVDAPACRFEGTAPYVSPQVAGGEPEDTRCDIYSFGALLYEMLTGEQPYDGGSPSEILERIRSGPPVPILKRNPAAPAGLVTIAEGCMEREQADRYANMRDVMADLELVAQGKAPLRPRRHPRRWLKIAVLAALLLAGGLLVISAYHARMRPPQNHLEVFARIAPAIEGWQWSGARIGNWRTSNDPVIISAGENRVVLARPGIPAATIWPVKSGASLHLLDGLVDSDGDGRDEVFVSWRERDDMYIAMLNQNYHAIKHFHAKGHPLSGAVDERPLSEMSFESLVDVDGDGAKEVIARVGTGDPLKPRGIYCFDFESTALRWSYPIAGYVFSVAFVDVEGDGRSEILVGSNAVQNGNSEADGTDDEHSWLYMLNCDGGLRWVQRVSHFYTRAKLVVDDVDADGRADIFVYVPGGQEHWLNRGYAESGLILRYDYEGNVIARHDMGVRVMSAMTADLEGDGRKTILVTDRRGLLHEFHPSLRLIRSHRLIEDRYNFMIEFHLTGIEDLAGDTKPEIVLSSIEVEFISGLNEGRPDGEPNVRNMHRPQIFVLDASFDRIANYVVNDSWTENLGFAVRMADFTHDGRSEIVCLGPEITILKWR